MTAPGPRLTGRIDAPTRMVTHALAARELLYDAIARSPTAADAVARLRDAQAEIAAAIKLARGWAEEVTDA